MSSWINEAGWDRGLRVAGGIVLLGIAYFAVAGTTQVVIAAAGLLLVVTGVAGFCPLYHVLGLNTCRLGAPRP